MNIWNNAHFGKEKNKTQKMKSKKICWKLHITRIIALKVLVVTHKNRSKHFQKKNGADCRDKNVFNCMK